MVKHCRKIVRWANESHVAQASRVVSVCVFVSVCAEERKAFYFGEFTANAVELIRQQQREAVSNITHAHTHAQKHTHTHTDVKTTEQQSCAVCWLNMKLNELQAHTHAQKQIGVM